MTRESYGAAYQTGFRQTVRFLISRGIRSESAMEAAQAGWVCGWEFLDQLRDETFLKTWVNKIALNFHRQQIRREARLCPLCDVAGESGAARYAAAIEMRRVLSVCTPRDKALFLHLLTGENISEVAGRLGITRTAARIRFFRARRSARLRLERAARIAVQA